MNETMPRPGRPRRHGSQAEKHRDYRLRRAERTRLVDDLLMAVRNATLDDPGLHQVAQYGDDAALLVALTAYYRARHFIHPQPERSDRMTEA
jgi:hypothetical protein